MAAHLFSLTWASLLGFAMIPGSAGAALPEFAHHLIPNTLPLRSNSVGDYGLTALADLDNDGDLDFVLGGRGVQPPRVYWFEYVSASNWVQHTAGTNYQSDVGLAALDVDRDGHLDLVCSGVWYRNTGSPRTEAFERVSFGEQRAGAHDVLVHDLNRDGRPDILMMGDSRTQLNGLYWFEISANPKEPWTRHKIGPPIHGAILPAGIMDVDRDGDPDVLRGDTWFENKDGKAREWTAHANIPFGRVGPYGMCVRTAVSDLDGDGQEEVVIGDADIVDSRVAILRNADGRGGSWTREELPRSFTYGSLHSLAVADLNSDGKPDIIVNEQEELLPPDRRNPRWVAWENLGKGKFAERIILDQKLGGHDLQVGDVDRDGDIDICSKPWGVLSWNGLEGKMHVDFLENRLRSPRGK